MVIEVIKWIKLYKESGVEEYKRWLRHKAWEILRVKDHKREEDTIRKTEKEQAKRVRYHVREKGEGSPDSCQLGPGLAPSKATVFSCWMWTMSQNPGVRQGHHATAAEWERKQGPLGPCMNTDKNKSTIKATNVSKLPCSPLILVTAASSLITLSPRPVPSTYYIKVIKIHSRRIPLLPKSTQFRRFHFLEPSSKSPHTAPNL